MALPGRYIYIRDNETSDYWSVSWQPVGKPLDKYKSECRHGTAYTVISAEYADIKSEVTYYIPYGKTYEVWRTKVTNNSEADRKLSLFGFVEFTNEDNYEQDQVNLQYSLFISKTRFEENKIIQTISENSATDRRERVFGMVGADVTASCGDLASFIGPYRTYSNPIAVETGKCSNIMNYNSNSCGALQSDIVLKPGETRELIYILGQKNNEEASAILNEYKKCGKVDSEIAELKNYWHGQLENFKVETPSEEFNNMINVWNAYQCFITFVWSRAVSFIYCGLRNGYGYRDTVQDIQGIIHLDPEMAADKIRFMLSAQVDNGGGLPLVKFNHNAGHENTPDDPEYVKETGHPSYRADDPFETLEEHWAYWSRYIDINRYMDAPNDTYKRLFELVKDKDYFVLTTNVDHQFWKAGFADEAIFATQGDYGKIQCKKGCHPKTYDAVELFVQMNQSRKDCLVPSYMVPEYPVCGGNMAMHLRCDQYFVEDEHWHQAAEQYVSFLEEHRKDRVALLELGVGFNTPTIIRFPFEQMMRKNENWSLIRLNLKEAFVPESFGKRAAGIGADIEKSLCDIIKGVEERHSLAAK